MQFNSDRLKQLVAGYPPDAVDEMAVPSYTHWNPVIRWLVWKRVRMAQALCIERSFDTVLDYGTGVGIMLPFLSAHSSHVIAVDQHIRPATELCRHFNLPNVELHEVQTAPLPISDGIVDMITCLEVLEHIKDLEQVIAEFHRVLRPGGRLIVSVPTENKIYHVGRYIAGFQERATYHFWDADTVNAAVMRTFARTKHRRLFPFPRFYDFSVFVKEA